jgi:RNA-directed DNA polymerase
MRWNKQYHEKHKAYSLYGKLFEYKRMLTAWKKVKKNKGASGIDQISITRFENQLELQLNTIKRQLHGKSYKPQPVRRMDIQKRNSSKKRKLGIPTVRDRVIQQVLKGILEPIFEPHFSEHSYGYRPGRNTHDALNEIETLRREHNWVVDTDIKGFFDNVDHDILIDLVNERVSDGSILKLIRLFLKAGVMHEGKLYPTRIGTPQGGVISPLLANIYLNHLDRRLEEMGYHFVRYADDIVIFCRNKAEAIDALEFARNVLQQDLRLQLNEQKTKIKCLKYEPDEQGNLPPEYGSIDFLGFRISKLWMSPTPDSINRFKDSIRSRTVKHIKYKTKDMCGTLNAIIRGWGNYFRVGSVKTLFTKLDKWIRMRVRLVLGRRKSKVRNNYRWRYVLNHVFTEKVLEEMGLTTLTSLLGKSLLFSD